MKAIVVEEYGGNIQYKDVEPPSLPVDDDQTMTAMKQALGGEAVSAKDCLIVQIQCVGAAYFDNLQLHGRYQVKSPLPVTPGAEAAGVVKEVGPNCKLQPGDKVALTSLLGMPGLCKEQAVVHEMQCTKLPDEMTDVKMRE